MSWIKTAITLSFLLWGAWVFKKIEPYAWPVVVDFEIKEVVQNPDGAGRGSTLIAGSLTKKRDCQFIETIAVSGNILASIQYQETAYNSSGVVSRPVGHYDWGWWAIIPSIQELTLYSRHMCSTGEVLTKLYDGRL